MADEYPGGALFCELGELDEARRQLTEFAVTIAGLRVELASVRAKAEADMARARLSLVLALGALNTALGETPADLEKAQRCRVLRRRIDEIAATLAGLSDLPG